MRMASAGKIIMKNTEIEKNLFKEEWNKIESLKPKPSNYRKLILLDHKEFVSKIHEKDFGFIKSIVESIYNGDLYILKNAISKENVDKLIDEIYKFSHSTPSTFHKMLEGVPNFHRWIDEKAAVNYCIKHVKHSTFLFPWNKEMSFSQKVMMDACRPLKLLAGLSLYEFENNTPKDKIIERLQVVRYPPSGYIEPHFDNSSLIRLIISGYLSKKGKHYEKGGFYLIDKKNGKLDMEDQIDAGDIGFFYATLRHGLDVIDPHKKPEFDKRDGRWWFGLNMHNSDEVEASKRHTAAPYKVSKIS